jgi:hypothetical protein
MLHLWKSLQINNHIHTQGYVNNYMLQLFTPISEIFLQLLTVTYHHYVLENSVFINKTIQTIYISLLRHGSYQEVCYSLSCNVWVHTGDIQRGGLDQLPARQVEV